MYLWWSILQDCGTQQIHLQLCPFNLLELQLGNFNCQECTGYPAWTLEYYLQSK